ncbi:MAG: TetR/AcrR family transcriptional regulator, partial [Actinomycetota bacterium]|nr:TetR/AcrR family transcriptional regulator [Actinomycetota bacterium]
HDLKATGHFFVEFCTEDPVRYQLLFQRTIPGFEPSAESFALSAKGLEAVRKRLAGMGLTDPKALDLLTAIGAGLTDQQISNDPGGDRWVRLSTRPWRCS